MDKKKTFMISAIAVIMIVLFGLWIVNLQSFVRPGSSQPLAANFNFDEAKGQFDKSMADLQVKLEVFDKNQATPAEASTTDANLKNFSNSLANELGATTSSNTALATSTNIATSSSAVVESAELQALKAKIDALNNKIKPLK